MEERQQNQQQEEQQHHHGQWERQQQQQQQQSVEQQQEQGCKQQHELPWQRQQVQLVGESPQASLLLHPKSMQQQEQQQRQHLDTRRLSVRDDEAKQQDQENDRDGQQQQQEHVQSLWSKEGQASKSHPSSSPHQGHTGKLFQAETTQTMANAFQQAAKQGTDLLVERPAHRTTAAKSEHQLALALHSGSETMSEEVQPGGCRGQTLHQQQKQQEHDFSGQGELDLAGQRPPVCREQLLQKQRIEAALEVERAAEQALAAEMEAQQQRLRERAELQVGPEDVNSIALAAHYCLAGILLPGCI
jgi:hypothetical protein